MATQFRSGAVSGNPGSASSLAVTLPAGMTAGDLVVIVGEVCDSDVDFSVPAGWVVNDSDFDAAFVGQNGVIISGYWDGVAASVTVTAEVAGTPTAVGGWYFTAQAFYDDTAGAIAITGAEIATSLGSPGATAICPAAAGGGATDAVVRAVGLSFFNNSSFDSSAPAGYTDPGLSISSNPGIRRGYIASYYDLSDDGDSPKNITSSGNNYWVAFTVSIGAVASCVPPTADVDPSIAGTPEVGETLTLTQGTYSGDPTIVVTDQWYRFCGSGPEELIAGATGLTYEVTDDDLGCDLFVRETADNGCPPGAEEDTNSLGPVTCGPPTNLSLPTVTGVAAVGHILEGGQGSWLCAATFDLQWYLDCGGGPVPLLGETGDTITTNESMVGCTLLFGVIAHGPGGDSGEVFSAPFGPIVANVPAAVRFYQSPPWRFVVLDKNTFQTLSFLDHIATGRTATFVLNSPAVATGRVPSDNPEINIPWPGVDDDPFLSEGNRVLLGFRREGANGSDDRVWVIRFAGVILQLEDEAGSDDSFTPYTAYDPWQLLFKRPVRNGPDLDFTLPGLDGSSYTATRIDVIAGEILRNTIETDGPVLIDAGPDYGGTAFWEGTIEELDQIDINFSQGTSVGEAWQQLTNMDGCDIILRPIYDPIRRPGYLVEMSIYAQAGAVQDDAIFAWDKPSHSLVGISRLRDGNERANVVKYFAGQGGTAVDGQIIAAQEDAASIAKFGEYWRQQFWPGQNVADAVLKLAQAQLRLSKDGKTTVAISPASERSPIPFEEYYLGDRVPIYASSRLRQKLAGYQRIYGIPIEIADDQTETILQMLTAVQS